MLKKKISAVVLASMIMNLSATPIKAFADNLNINVSQEAEVSKFYEYYSSKRQAYDDVFKMNNSNIEKITSTGGILRANVGTDNIIDGNLDTYWETGKHTSNSFKN